MKKSAEHHFHPSHKTIALIAFFSVFLLGFVIMMTVLPYAYTVVDDSRHNTHNVSDELPIEMFKFNF